MTECDDAAWSRIRERAAEVLSGEMERKASGVMTVASAWTTNIVESPATHLVAQYDIEWP